MKQNKIINRKISDKRKGKILYVSFQSINLKKTSSVIITQIVFNFKSRKTV